MSLHNLINNMLLGRFSPISYLNLFLFFLFFLFKKLLYSILVK